MKQYSIMVITSIHCHYCMCTGHVMMAEQSLVLGTILDTDEPSITITYQVLLDFPEGNENVSLVSHINSFMKGK